MFYQKTFKARAVLNLDAAGKAHLMVRNAVSKNRRLPAQAVTTIWDAITGRPGSGALYTLVDVSTPSGYTVLLRTSDSVAAAFAFCAVLARLEPVDLADDDAVRAALRLAWNDFEVRRMQANAVQEGFGCDDSQSWHTLRDIQECPDSDNLRHKILEIAKLAGEMVDALRASATKVPTDDRHKVTGATVGGKLEDLVPNEVSRLGDPGALGDLQRMRVLTKKAVVRELHGETTAGRGPMSLVLDESASMHEEAYAGRGRNTWCKACAIALIRLAWEEGREVRVTHFATATVIQKVSRHDYRALFEMARSFLSGGTDFAGGLRVGFEQVGDLAAAGHSGADVVFITDGSEDYLTYGNNQRMLMNQTLDEMDRDGVKLWTIGIGARHDPEFPLRKRAAKWVFAHDRDLGDATRTSQILGDVREAAENND